MNAQHSRRTVVVGIDGSQSALRAARWGAEEAGRRRIPLRLVTAFGWTADHDFGHPGLGQQFRDTLLDRSRGQLAEAAATAERATSGIDIEQQLIVGYPLAVLAAEARRAQLMVIGDSGLGRVEGMLAGSVAVGLATHASCPVVVVRGAEREPPATASLPIVVGVDGSPTSEAAIEFAFDAAARRGVPLVAVHAWWDRVFDVETTPEFDWNAIEATERELLSERLAGWAEKYPDVPVERLVVRHRPAHGLLEQADRAQLVVVGSRGRGEFAGLVLGSVSNVLLHRASCPVVVIRPDAGETA